MQLATLRHSNVANAKLRAKKERMPQDPTDIKTMFNLRLIEGSLEVKLPTIWTDEKQSRLSYLFAHLYLLSSHSFSDSSHLCFPSFHIVGSLTSKLPSI